MWGLGWKPLEGWWSWQLPDEVEPFDMVRDPERPLMHRLREALRGQQLRNLEQRRPRQFQGMRGEVLKDVLNAALAKHTDALERTLLLGALAGATWTAELAFRRGLRKDPHCPYCGQGVVKDEDHLFWGCSAWAVVRDPTAARLVTWRGRKSPGYPKSQRSGLRACGSAASPRRICSCGPRLRRPAGLWARCLQCVVGY